MVNGYAGVRNRYHPYLKDSVKMHPFGTGRNVAQFRSGNILPPSTKPRACVLCVPRSVGIWFARKADRQVSPTNFRLGWHRFQARSARSDVPYPSCCSTV